MIKIISTYFSDFDKAKCEVLFNTEVKKCILKYYNYDGRHISTENLETSNIEAAERTAEHWIDKYNERKNSPSSLIIDLIKTLNKTKEKTEKRNDTIKNIFFE